MKTRKINTESMEGNKDVEGIILDILCSEYGMAEVMTSEYDFSEALYSNGFIHAIEMGLIPEINTIAKTTSYKKDQEYHHMIANDECYCVYFKQ